MKADDYKAVFYGGSVYCTSCLPRGVDPGGSDVEPIYAASEWEEYPQCVVCGAEHDYVVMVEDAASEDDPEELDFEDEGDYGDYEEDDYEDEDDFLP